MRTVYVKYLGQIVDAKGRRPDPLRSSKIKDMAAPTNVTKSEHFY